MTDARGLTVWTIGHSSRPWEEFLALLKRDGSSAISWPWSASRHLARDRIGGVIGCLI